VYVLGHSFQTVQILFLFKEVIKKVYFMGSKMQPGLMRAQKREILISRVKKNIFCVKKLKKKLRTGSLFYSKLILKLVISFMNRKSSCGYATHFLSLMNVAKKNRAAVIDSIQLL
jgi:hypothetical protein